MAANYWSGISHSTLNRRRALAASGALALGTAFLAACGGGDGDGGGGAGKSSLVSKPVDTTKQVKRATLKDRTFADTPSLDVLTPSLPHNGIGPFAYSSLFAFKPGYLKA